MLILSQKTSDTLWVLDKPCQYLSAEVEVKSMTLRIHLTSLKSQYLLIFLEG
jgi:hypothetical protein